MFYSENILYIVFHISMYNKPGFREFDWSTVQATELYYRL